MASLEDRFSVKIRLEVGQTAGSKSGPIMEADLVYHQMKYPQVVGVEAQVVGMVNDLVELGVQAAEEMAKEATAPTTEPTQQDSAVPEKLVAKA